MEGMATCFLEELVRLDPLDVPSRRQLNGGGGELANKVGVTDHLPCTGELDRFGLVRSLRVCWDVSPLRRNWQKNGIDRDRADQWGYETPFNRS
jgi:hypothetical protein